MKAMMEITKWPDGKDYSHMYWLDDDKVLAYSKWGTGAPEYFKAPWRIDKRRRKFVEVKVHPFKEVAEETPDYIVEVKGSNGAVYKVDTKNRTCTCPAAKFRGGECKHIKGACK